MVADDAESTTAEDWEASEEDARHAAAMARIKATYRKQWVTILGVAASALLLVGVALSSANVAPNSQALLCGAACAALGVIGVRRTGTTWTCCVEGARHAARAKAVKADAMEREGARLQQQRSESQGPSPPLCVAEPHGLWRAHRVAELRDEHERAGTVLVAAGLLQAAGLIGVVIVVLSFFTRAGVNPALRDSGGLNISIAD